MATRLLLITSAVVAALAAGCGGAKSTSDSAGSSASDGTSAPQATTTPAAADTGAAPALPAPAAPTGDVGAQVFVKRCVLCHGADGRGDGIASKGLNPKPRNFHDQAYMNTRTDTQLLEIIHKGKGVMPRWEGQLSEAEIQAVLAHVRSLAARP